MSAVRWVISLLGAWIISAWSMSVGWSQCLSAVDVQTRIDRAKRTPTGVTAQLFADIRRQLIQNQCPADSLLARVTMQLGYAQYLQQQPDSAVPSLQESIRLFLAQPRGQRAGLVSAYMYLGQVLHSQNNVRLATKAYRSCIALGRYKDRYDAPVGYALNDLALLAYQNGDYEIGLTYAEQATERARRCRNVRLEARSLSEAARCLLYLNRYVTALRYCDQAIVLLQTDSVASDDRRLCAFFRAQALVGLGQYDLALTLYRQIRTEYEQTNQCSHVADVCGYIGELYADRLNNPTQAAHYFQQAHGLYENPYEQSRMLQSMGNLQKRAGQYQAALHTFQQALRTLPIQFQQQDPRADPSPDAIRLSAYKEYLLTLIWNKADTWLDWAKTGARPRQQLEQALRTYRLADQMVDRMRWEQSGQQSKLYWRQQTHALYERALETCYRLGNAEQAFYFFEKSRAVLLADKLNELGASQLLSPEQQATETRLRQTLDRQLADLRQLRPGSTAYAQAKTKLSVAQEQVDTFVQQLEVSNPAYYRYKYDNHVVSLAELTEYLNERPAAFVTYFVGDSALYSLCVQGAKTHLVRQPLGTYRQDVRAYLNLLGQPQQLNRSFPSFLTLGSSLHARLLTPLAVARGRVIVSPDGLFIPFETLSKSASEADYALKDFAFSYAYSARLLVRSGTSTVDRWGTGDFLGVAPVQFGTSLKQVALPGSEAVVRAIGKQFASARLLLNENATRQAFQNESPSYRIVHLFTHAVGGQADQEPQLFFADSTLPLSALATNRLTNTQLVTLAACETGTGINQQGEGVFSLARGFAALGVPSILTTLWRVPNEATYQISSQFYKQVAAGVPKDVALQRARLTWLQQANGVDRLPSTWAGLILVGNADPLTTRKPSALLGSLSGLALGGAGLLGWRRWRRRRSANTQLI